MWKTIIGLEIHAQLKTETKIFSSSINKFGDAANMNINEVDLGFPGALPVLNERVLELATRFGLAVGAKINQRTLFARKNYFYPDLPKGYQITQNELPIVEGGSIVITGANGESKTIRLNRAHLEEDAGKNSHDIYRDYSAVDLNRAGVPLLEIVSEPDMNSKEEALEYIKKIHQLVRFLGVCSGDMFAGAFRCDVNISVRDEANGVIGERVELKNINSFKFIERAIEFEVERQISELEAGRAIVRETRLFNSDTGETSSMRLKEDATDYRYFFDPDLLAFQVSDELIENVKKALPELPEVKLARFISLGVSEADANVLMHSPNLADYFDEVASLSKDAVLASRFVVGDLMAMLNKIGVSPEHIETFPLSARQLADIIIKLKENAISSKMAKELFLAVCEDSKKSVAELIVSLGMVQVSDEGELEGIIDGIISKNPDQVAQYLGSDEGRRKKLVGFFVGQVMAETKGKANPAKINEILGRKLK